MEFIFEVLMELILEGSVNISSNKKISKFIRYPLICFIVLVFGTVIGCLLIAGVMILHKSILGGLFLIAVGLFLLINSILKFKALYLSKKEVEEKEEITLEKEEIEDDLQENNV